MTAVRELIRRVSMLCLSDLKYVIGVTMTQYLSSNNAELRVRLWRIALVSGFKYARGFNGRNIVHSGKLLLPCTGRQTRFLVPSMVLG